MASKSLIYRKTMLKTIYRLSKVFDEVIDYEEYKDAILNNQDNKYKYFYYLKGLYKCYQFILHSQITHFNPLVINILYNLLFSKNLSRENQLNILYANVCSEDIIENIIRLISVINIEDKNDKYVFDFIIMVYLFYVKYQAMYNYSNAFFKIIYHLISNGKDYQKIYQQIKQEVTRNAFPEESYYDNLIEVKPNEIISFLKEKENYIKYNFKIKSLYLYGSFAKNSYRIDSDIDIAGKFIEDISYEEKENMAIKIKQFIFERFQRYGDFMEYSLQLLNDEKHIKIY